DLDSHDGSPEPILHHRHEIAIPVSWPRPDDKTEIEGRGAGRWRWVLAEQEARGKAVMIESSVGRSWRKNWRKRPILSQDHGGAEVTSARSWANSPFRPGRS